MTFVSRMRSEFAYLVGIVSILRRTVPIAKHPRRTVGDLIEDLARRFGTRVALVSRRETLTFEELNRSTNRYARWARARGFRKGDTLGLMMPNRAEYLSIWIGFAKAGAATALLNTNTSGAALAHAINAVGARTVVVAAELLPQFETARPYLDDEFEVVVHGDPDPTLDPTVSGRIDREVATLSDAPLDAAERPALTIDDRCLYVFTSGTTGMPKAANLNHYRVQLAMHAFNGVTRARRSDRMYDCLPMYHTNGGVVAPGAVLIAGGTCVIAERFSAREFWPDVIRHRCTMFIYIGELCRYLLQVPESPDDRRHAIRLCVGNGLRPDVWAPFRDRFKIPHIREFYGATEGNCSVFNLDSRPQAVGRVPSWIAGRFPIRIVRYDVEADAVVRDASGLCIPCTTGQIGELIGQIVSDPRRPGSRFEGYTDREATDRKVLRDVFVEGDAWFRTGDLMRRDADGYFFFIDRVGDTFRWKGENVATSQVGETITGYPAVKDATVYGVQVPGTEGRAGMASIVVDAADALDPQALWAYLAARLPGYAVPVFVRLAPRLDLTGTFKQRKLDLVADGFDPGRIADPLLYSDPTARTYRRLDAAAFAAIGAGRVRF